jgi:hypothetical protein
MRPCPRDPGWVGSLFEKPKDCVKAKKSEKSVAPEAPVLQDCSDCLCPACANNGESCKDCKGPEQCAKKGGKMGLCPDFRAADGKGQDCLNNGCKCLTCEIIGDTCRHCPGPVRCDEPKLTCTGYRGAEAPYPGDDKMPDLLDVLSGKAG